MLIVEEK